MLLRKSENNKIGILPPGPISNDCLFERIPSSQADNNVFSKGMIGGQTPLRIKKGLQLNRDYRGVNREVWQIFHRMYGGGPIIVREDLDIYSKDLQNEIASSKRPKKKAS